MITKVIASVILFYFAFVSSGFFHEGGHSAVGGWVGIEISGFSAMKCFQLNCTVYALEELVGWQGYAVLFAGGLFASAWWAAIYLMTIRWHRTSGWLVGSVAAALSSGEFVVALFEGGWNWFYSNYEIAVLFIVFFVMVISFRIQINFSGQGTRLEPVTRWLSKSSWTKRHR